MVSEQFLCQLHTKGQALSWYKLTKLYSSPSGSNLTFASAGALKLGFLLPELSAQGKSPWIRENQHIYLRSLFLLNRKGPLGRCKNKDRIKDPQIQNPRSCSQPQRRKPVPVFLFSVSECETIQWLFEAEPV